MCPKMLYAPYVTEQMVADVAQGGVHAGSSTQRKELIIRAGAVSENTAKSKTTLLYAGFP